LTRGGHGQARRNNLKKLTVLMMRQIQYTVLYTLQKKVIDFPDPRRDGANQTLSGR
jgi:hypothetical protein